MSYFSLMLAPLEGITGPSFRSVCHKYGADLTFTEMSRIDALARNNQSTLSRLSIHSDTPTVIQLFGLKESDFSKFLKSFSPPPGFRGFNLNLGCPASGIIRLGMGCAMIRRVAKTQKIVKVFRDLGFPVSVKLRLGLNDADRQKKVYLNLIEGVDADFFIVHARHALQSYQEPADFSVYRDCVATGKAIVANGDISTTAHIDSLRSVGCSGAMIGRYAAVFPSVFARLKGLPSPPDAVIKKESLSLSESIGEDVRYRKALVAARSLGYFKGLQ